jgi:hypothetical protein
MINRDLFVAKAKDYADRAGRVGDPEMRPMVQSNFATAYMTAIDDVIAYLAAQRLDALINRAEREQNNA